MENWWFGENYESAGWGFEFSGADNLQIHLIGGEHEQGNGQGNAVGKTEGNTA